MLVRGAGVPRFCPRPVGPPTLLLCHLAPCSVQVSIQHPVPQRGVYGVGGFHTPHTPPPPFPPKNWATFSSGPLATETFALAALAPVNLDRKFLWRLWRLYALSTTGRGGGILEVHRRSMGAGPEGRLGLSTSWDVYFAHRPPPPHPPKRSLPAARHCPTAVRYPRVLRFRGSAVACASRLPSHARRGWGGRLGTTS